MARDDHAAGDSASAGVAEANQPLAPAGSGRSPALLALVIGLLTLLADQVAGIARLSAARADLAKARAAQDQPLEQARRIESQLDALATGTAELAAQGNPNAAAIVASLQAQGVSIKPPGQVGK